MFFRSNFQIFPFPLTLILVTISHGELVSEAQQWIYFHVGTVPPWSPPRAAKPCFSSTAHPWWSFSSCRLHCHTLHKPPTRTSGSLLYHSIPALPTTVVSSITQSPQYEGMYAHWSTGSATKCWWSCQTIGRSSFPPYSALVWLKTEYHIQLWGLQFKRSNKTSFSPAKVYQNSL